MKRFPPLLLITLICSAAFAQQKLSFSVLEFEQDVFDTSAKSTEYGKKDGNGSWYAIIKVTSNNPDDDITACQFNFGNMASKVEKHDEALWVYVQRNAKKVTISRPGYHTISQYDLQTTIEAGANYKMVLTSDRVQQQVVYDVKMQMVKFQTSPAVQGAMIMATNQATGSELAIGVTDENGVVYKAMDNGKYSYRVMCTDNMYHPSEGIMALTGFDETHEEKVVLRPNYADIILSAADNAEILINNERKGSGSWQGRLTQGTYVITTRKSNHRDSQQRVVVEEGKAQTIQLNAPTPIIGTLVVNSKPYEADIIIDGKEYGKAPRIIKDMIIGQHNILLRKSGHGDYTTSVTVVEGQTQQIDATLPDATNITFTSNVPDATLYIDGNAVGKSSGTYSLAYGTHTLKVNAAGYNPYSESLTVTVGSQQNSFNIRLRPLFGNETFTVNGVSFTMIAVEGGTFTMGATSEQEGPYDDEKPTHQVTLSTYYIGETEVTQALWQAVMGSNPSSFKSDQNPVEKVSWNDCQTFISKLNQTTGKKFRLPTEAEWEFAARGGNKSQHTQYSGSSNIDEVAWYTSNSGSATHPVKQKKANELGIYDMAGNVWEWCQDWKGLYSSSAQSNPTGPSSGSGRVFRGGSWSGDAGECRSSGRVNFTPDARVTNIGLRLALSEYNLWNL